MYGDVRPSENVWCVASVTHPCALGLRPASGCPPLFSVFCSPFPPTTPDPPGPSTHREIKNTRPGGEAWRSEQNSWAGGVAWQKWKRAKRSWAGVWQKWKRAKSKRGWGRDRSGSERGSEKVALRASWGRHGGAIRSLYVDLYEHPFHYCLRPRSPSSSPHHAGVPLPWTLLLLAGSRLASAFAPPAMTRVAVGATRGVRLR